MIAYLMGEVNRQIARNSNQFFGYYALGRESRLGLKRSVPSRADQAKGSLPAPRESFPSIARQVSTIPLEQCFSVLAGTAWSLLPPTPRTLRYIPRVPTWSGVICITGSLPLSEYILTHPTPEVNPFWAKKMHEISPVCLCKLPITQAIRKSVQLGEKRPKLNRSRLCVILPNEGIYQE